MTLSVSQGFNIKTVKVAEEAFWDACTLHSVWMSASLSALRAPEMLLNQVSQPDDGGSKLLWNAGHCRQCCMLQHPRRRPSSYSWPSEPEILLKNLLQIQANSRTTFTVCYVITDRKLKYASLGGVCSGRAVLWEPAETFRFVQKLQGSARANVSWRSHKPSCFPLQGRKVI
jgi:hypothetical protein